MKKSISVILAIATIAVALCAAVTVCWLDESTGSVDFNEHFHGSTEAAYFAGGTGSADSPYEIRSAVHLYNLAWLQYLGYFNMNPDFNNGLAQSHFVVKEKVDMSAFKSAIPPIGTTEYPFIGVFDGGDNTIVSVRVSNNVGSTDNALKIRPSNAEFNGTTRLFVTDKSAEVSVVGLFGVTGDYDGYIAKYKAANAGFTDENAAAMSVGNFYADYLHIYSGSSATLTGLVAGYAGSGISNVGVYRGDINYASGASGFASASSAPRASARARFSAPVAVLTTIYGYRGSDRAGRLSSTAKPSISRRTSESSKKSNRSQASVCKSARPPPAVRTVKPFSSSSAAALLRLCASQSATKAFRLSSIMIQKFDAKGAFPAKRRRDAASFPEGGRNSLRRCFGGAKLI